MMQPPSSTLVSLRPGPSGGLAVPVAALQLLWSLEARDFRLRQHGDRLLVEPGKALTPDDCAQITQWKSHLLALLRYEARVCA